MNALEYVKNWWKDASPVSRALVVTGVVAIVTALSYFGTQEPETDFAPLFTRLEAADAAQVVENLAKEKIPYQLHDGGATIMVPRERLYALRLTMASAGLPKGGGVGFEIFDQTSAFMNTFTQKVNYTRAIQGELARTIGELPEVESARVHLALPENSLFSRDAREPSASVYLKLHQGRTLTPKQIMGITHLVASSVENLSSERIAVLDGNGRLLGDAPTDSSGVSSRAISLVHDHETRLEHRVVELLEPIVGRGKIVVRATVDMDLSKAEETSEDYDADRATVRSQTDSNETSNSASGSGGGLAGTPGNLPNQPALANAPTSGSRQNADRSSTQVDYAIPKVVRHVKRAMGKVDRLSIAVLVDGPERDPLPAGTPKTDGTITLPSTTPEGQPVAVSGRAALANLVKKAVGFDEKRGDQLEVVFAPFSPVEVAAEAAAAPEEKPFAIPAWAPIVLVLVAGFAGVFVAIRNTERRRRAELEAMRRANEEQVLRKLDDEKKPAATRTQQRPQAGLREEVRNVSGDNVDATVSVMKAWLTESMKMTREGGR